MKTFYINKIEIKLRNCEDKLELVKKHLDIDYLFLNTFEFRDRLLHFEKKINDLNEENTELKQQINNLTNKN